MQKSFITWFLAFILVAASAFPFENVPNRKRAKTLRFLEDYATNSGNIPLILGDLGLLVHVDFADHSADASESDEDNTDYGNMVIALYTDQTFFGKACQGFEDYCLKYTNICIHGNTTTVTFPYFVGSGEPIIPEVFLDYSHWSLKSHAIASTSCSGNYSGGGYGFLGMGFSDFSLANFLSRKPNFAVQVSKDLNNGTFAFNVDMKNAKSSDPVATLSSDNLWHVSNLGSITIKDTTIDANAFMIFDLGSDSVGLPQSIYEQVINRLEQSPLVESCQAGGDFRPICGFSGDIRNLPTITLNVGTQQIDIPPLIYVVQTQDTYFYYNSITLKLKILSTDASQGSLVTPEYENYVILGYPVMSYYYTVFESNSIGGGTISLYTSNEYSSASDMTWLFVVVGIIGLLTIGIIFYLFDKKYRKKVAEPPLLEGQEDIKPRAVRRLH